MDTDHEVDRLVEAVRRAPNALVGVSLLIAFYQRKTVEFCDDLFRACVAEGVDPTGIAPSWIKHQALQIRARSGDGCPPFVADLVDAAIVEAIDARFSELISSVGAGSGTVQ